MSHMIMRSGTILCLVMMSSMLPRMAVANDEKIGTTEEVIDYAQREAQAVGLEDFQGGNAIGLAIVLLAVFLLGVIFYGEGAGISGG